MGTTQFHLTGDGYCWRGVRMRALGPDEIDDAAAEAGREVSDGDPAVKYQNIKVRRSLLRSIVAVTAADVGRAEAKAARAAAIAEATGTSPLVKEQAREAGEAAAQNALMVATWIPVTHLQLMDGADPLAYVKLFPGKNHEALTSIYMRLFNARMDEVDAIMGKALAVSEG